MSTDLASPEPRTPSPEPLSADEPSIPASRSLSPTDRDFEIYEAIHIAGCSTYSQARKHDISQTRVRQIVRRVVEWLSEVLPPQAKIAREQEIHLARQIAADRYRHQLEEVTEFWHKTRETKYASLRIRLTTAQARLGVVGGLLDGLAADAIEGLPVPAWKPSEVVCASSDSEPKVVRGSPDPAPANPIPNPQSQFSNSPAPSHDPIDPGEAKLLNALRYIWPPTERVRLAVELEQALEFLSPEDREAIRANEAQHLPTQQLALEAAVRAGQISGEDAYLIDPASYSPSPPIEDCSTKIESPDAAPESLAENLATSSSYDNTTETESDQFAPSHPLLTSPPPEPVTALTITPAQPGATISTSPTTTPAPVPCTLRAEPSRPAAV